MTQATQTNRTHRAARCRTGVLALKLQHVLLRVCTNQFRNDALVRRRNKMSTFIPKDFANSLILGKILYSVAYSVRQRLG